VPACWHECFFFPPSFLLRTNRRNLTCSVSLPLFLSAFHARLPFFPFFFPLFPLRRRTAREHGPYFATPPFFFPPFPVRFPPTSAAHQVSFLFFSVASGRQRLIDFRRAFELQFPSPPPPLPRLKRGNSLPPSRHLAGRLPFSLPQKNKIRWGVDLEKLSLFSSSRLPLLLLRPSLPSFLPFLHDGTGSDEAIVFPRFSSAAFPFFFFLVPQSGS